MTKNVWWPRVCWIDTLDSAISVCQELAQHSVVAFDMEGAHLGQDTACVSLIQLATSVDCVYIFDVMALGASLFSKHMLGSLLENDHVVKLCYDCRCDAHALELLYDLHPRNFYDLQIVYTCLFQSKSDPYLKGLHKALAVPGIILRGRTRVLRCKQQTKACGNLPERMMARPLAPHTLKYCALDVAHLFSMYLQWGPLLDHHVMLDKTHGRIQLFLQYRDRFASRMSSLDFSPCVIGEVDVS